MGIRPSLVFTNVKPKLDGGFKNIGLITPVDSTINTPALGLPITPAPGQGQGGETWKEFSINLSIMDVLSQADLNNFNTFLKGVDKVSRAMVALIKILRLLTNDLFSINRAFKFVIRVIVAQLRSLIQTFLSSGIYVTVVKPQNSPYDKGYVFPTWGSFDEFKSVLAAACTNPQDIGSPAQLGPTAKVGGFVIGAALGSNNPTAIDSVFHNFKVIGDLFGFETILPGPPKNAMAVGSSSNNKPNIVLTWDKCDSSIHGGFMVYRSMIKEGSFPSKDDMDKIIENSPSAKNPKQVRHFQRIRIFDNDVDSVSPDKPFNSGKPLFVKTDFTKGNRYSITDFDVNPGKTYYYRVYTVMGTDSGLTQDPYLFRLGSPMGSHEASAVAGGCIPVSEIPRGILTTSGEWISERDLMYKNSHWSQVSLDKFFGSQVDQLFKVIDNFADKLVGIVNTGSDAIDEFLRFFATKINDYIRIVQTMTNIVNVLMSFRLKGNLLLLDLTTAKTGGIGGFADRIVRAGVESSIFGRTPKSASEVISQSGIADLTNTPQLTKAMSDDVGRSLESLKGLYVGIIVVYGFVDPTDVNLKRFAAPYMEEYNDIKQKVSGSQAAINLLLKILLGKGT